MSNDSIATEAFSGSSVQILIARMSLIDKVILGGIAFCLLLQLNLQFVQKANWDEFFYLSKVYDFQRGDLTHALQSFHVHLFGWLPSLGGNEMDQIRVGRMVMWLFEIGTLISIFLTARCFVSRSSSLMAALAYVSSGFVLLHGTSFRTDPMAASLMMIGICILVRSKLGAWNLAAFVIAVTLAALVTIKVALFAPALVGIALWRLASAPEPAKLFGRLGTSALAILTLFAVFFRVHLSLLTVADTDGSKSMVSSAWNTTLWSAGLFPRAEVLAEGASLALPQTILLLMGVVLAFMSMKGKLADRMTGFVLVALVTPLASFAFYRNAFPYFLPFIFPPAMVLVGYAVEQLKGRKVLVYGLIALMSLGAIGQYAKRISENQVGQRETLEVVHKMFLTPVAYIDRCAMISSFPKVGFFMSGWGTKNYLETGRPILAQQLRAKVVPLLILNSPILEQAIETRIAPSAAVLHIEDVRALRESYIHHWGTIWIAGKVLRVGIAEEDFSIHIPGYYTVETDNVVRIDHQAYAPNSQIFLQRGIHTIVSNESQVLTLRWGENIFRPSKSAPKEPLFSGF